MTAPTAGSSPPMRRLADHVDALLRDLSGRAPGVLDSDEYLRSSGRELARRLAGLPGTTFAALLIAPPPDADERRRPHRVVIAGGDLPCARWDDLSPRANFFFDRIVSGDDETCAGSATELIDCGLPVRALRGCDSWLLRPVLAGPGLIVGLLLGLRSDEADTAGLSQAVDRIAAQISPLVDARVRIGLLQDELGAMRKEKDGLARLNRMQGEFVAVASHELKTPLTSIIAFSEVLQQQADRGNFPEAEEFTSVIHEESERLLRMVNRILDFSQLEFGNHVLHQEPRALEPLIRDTAKSMRPLLERKQQRLVIDFDHSLPRVDMDADLVQQALVNLVNNASKYSPPGGRIRVTTHEEAAMLRIRVADNGPGIPADEMRRIFRQFYRLEDQASEEGAGLGLTIVKHIVNLHGGQIDVRSQPGEGAEFSFNLPKEHCFSDRSIAGLDDESPDRYREVLRLCTLLVAEMADTRQVALLFPDQQGEELMVHSGVGLDLEALRTGVDLRREDLAARVFASGTGEIDHQPFEGDPLALAGMDDSRAAVPFDVKDRTRGVIVVSGRVDGRPCGGDDRDLLIEIARKVSAALAIFCAEEPGSRVENDLLVALRTLVQLRRDVIPTTSPLALRLVSRTAAALGMTAKERNGLQYVLTLHDAGMAQVDEDIVLKVGALTEDEREVIGQHPMEGVKLMAPLLPTPAMREIIISHHEWLDGSGYPEGRRGDEIPLGARVLAVIDAFFAMIMERPYRTGRPTPEVAAEIRAMGGTQFDPRVVDAFLSVLVAEGMLDPTEEAWPDSADGKESSWQPQES